MLSGITYWFSIHTFSCPLKTTFNSYLYCATTLKTCLLNAWLKWKELKYKCQHYYDYCNCIISMCVKSTNFILIYYICWDGLEMQNSLLLINLSKHYIEKLAQICIVVERIWANKIFNKHLREIFCISVHVLLNLLNEPRKRDKIRGLPLLKSLFCNELNEFYNSVAQILDYIYDMTLILFCNLVFDKSCPYLCAFCWAPCQFMRLPLCYSLLVCLIDIVCNPRARRASV